MSDYDWKCINKNASSMITKMTSKNGEYKKVMDYNFLKNLYPNENNNYKLDWKDIEEIFPHMVESMKETPQEPDYHAEGDVWTHTKMVVEALLDNLEYRLLPDNEKEIMFWTTLFHDIGKPGVTTRNEDNNRITSRGHSRRGMQDARLIMWHSCFPPELRESVARLILTHQEPFVWINEANIFKIRKMSQSVNMNHLRLMANSDAIGRETIPRNEKQTILDRVELFAFACEEEKCLHNPWTHNFENLHAERIYWESEGNSHPDRVVVWEEASDVIFLSGLPASGKDTWVSKFGEGKPVLSFDDARAMFGYKQTDNHGEAVQYVIKQAKILLAKREPFIWNATHLSPLTRDKHINLLRQYGAKVRILHLENDPKKLVSNNQSRDVTLMNEKIMKMAYNWEPPLPTDGHELIWWKDNNPLHVEYLTTKKDERSPWLFSQQRASSKFRM